MIEKFSNSVAPMTRRSRFLIYLQQYLIYGGNIMFEFFVIFMGVIFFPIMILLTILLCVNHHSLKKLTQRVMHLEKQLQEMANNKRSRNDDAKSEANQEDTNTSSHETIHFQDFEENVTVNNNWSRSAAPEKIEDSRIKKTLIQSGLTSAPAPSHSEATPKESILSHMKNILQRSGFFSIESIISKLGIILLLIGIGFMTKLAYDKHYISDSFLIVLGYIIAGVIFYLGNRVAKNGRKILSQVLFGGSISILYIATFAAYQGYGIISSFLALVLLIGITIIAFFVSVIKNSVSLSIIAILGGLFTPFLVNITYLGLYGLGVYIVMLALGSMVIYVAKRERALQLTTIIGINILLIILMNMGEFSSQERLEFSLLIAILLVIFNGIEYGLFYLSKETKVQSFITPILLGLLPMIALIQVISLLELSSHEWGILLFAMACIYLVLTTLIYLKKGHTIVFNINLSFIGFFGVVAIIQSFGGDIRYLAIMFLSLIFFYVARRIPHLYTTIIGYIIYGIGYLWAFYALIDQMDDGNLMLSQVLVRLGTVCLLTLGAFLQTEVVKKVLGTLTFLTYCIVVILHIVWYFTENSHPYSAMTIAFGLLLCLYIFIYKQFNLISLTFIVISSLIPFILHIHQLTYWFSAFSLHWVDTVSLILYSTLLYLITIFLFKKESIKLIVILKLFAYILLGSILLIDLTLLSDHFGYGLLLLGLFPICLFYLEPHGKHKEFIILSKVFKLSFLSLAGIYTLFMSRSTFNLIYFAVDLLLFTLIYYTLSKTNFNQRVQFILLAILYILLTFNNLHMTEGSILTLFWATYSILHLIYYLYKANKTFAYFSLGLIILVAIKFVLWDLSSVSIFWKIMTSMAFGIALLILSYFISPILNKKGH
jgi:hypothetical protein